MALRSGKSVSFLNDLSRHIVNGMTSPSDGCSEMATTVSTPLQVRYASVTHLLPDVTLSTTEVGENCYIKYYYHY